jgi:hypothetical protein
MYRVFIFVADYTYHFLSLCGYADGQWGILETGSRTPDLKGGLHTCPGLRTDISIVTPIATRGRAWWNFLCSYCSLCSTATLRCIPPPFAPQTPSRNVWLMFRSFYLRRLFSLQIALPFLFFLTHAYSLKLTSACIGRWSCSWTYFVRFVCLDLCFVRLTNGVRNCNDYCPDVLLLVQ